MDENEKEGVRVDKDHELILEAQRRFEWCAGWESDARKLFMDDLKFANADSDNGYQWPLDLRKSREIDARPCLTINKTRQHNLEIINEMKQSRPGVNVRAVGGGATYESAQMLGGLIRYIEYQSKATAAYNTAIEFQVNAGLGYLRVVTDYAGDNTFDQEIYIRRIVDPLTIYMDPESKELDRSDARFAFVFDEIEKDEFDEKYPEYEGIGGQSALGVDGGWVTSDSIRVCEYFRKVEAKDQLIYAEMPGQEPQPGQPPMPKQPPVIVLASTLPKEVLDAVLAVPETRTRDVTTSKIEWYFIIGSEVVETKDWIGNYIPLVPVIGEETIIEGQLDRKGHTRSMKDPQRIYNYWTSSAVEFIALQGKTPWVAPVEAIEGYEDYWKTANTINHAFLPYKGMGGDGKPIAPPQKPQPPQMAQGYLQGMAVARDELAMVSGQYAPQMGDGDNARTGIALHARQRKGDVATYHYTENFGIALQHLGRVIIDLIPKIYDTKRVLRVIAEDGTDLEVEIDPAAKQALMVKLNQDQRVAARILNPGVGKYEVEVQSGPNYGTKRQEAFMALTQIITQQPNLTAIIGDILLRAGDFPLADEAAERLKRMVPPQALGQGPTQAEQMLQTQMQSLQQALSTTMDQLATAKLKLKAKDQQRTVQAYDAETARIKVLADDMNPAALDLLIKQVVQEAIDLRLGPVVEASEPALRQAKAGGLPPKQMLLPLMGGQ